MATRSKIPDRCRRVSRFPPEEAVPRPGSGVAALRITSDSQVDTIDRCPITFRTRKKRDDVGSARDLERWLSRRGLLAAGTRLTPEDRGQAVSARGALRSLLAANNGGSVERGAVDRLDELIADARFQLRFDADGSGRFEPVDQGLVGALGKLLEFAVAAQIAGHWPRFKACADPGCGAAFFDATPNLRIKWCSKRCGDRIRARSYRRGEKYRRGFYGPRKSRLR